jgi:acetyl-CoA synthetase
MESGTTQHPNLSSILREHRVFPPPAEFAAQAHVKSLEEYETLYRRSIQDPEGVSGRRSRASCTGLLPGPACSNGSLPLARWFVGGKINLCYNCVDRHALSDRRTKSPFCGKASRARPAS